MLEKVTKLDLHNASLFPVSVLSIYFDCVAYSLYAKISIFFRKLMFSENPHLFIKATSLQRPLSPVREVAVVEMFDCNLFFPLICFKDYRNSKLARILSCVLAHALFTTQLKPNYRCFLNLLLRVSVSFREFKKTTTPLGTGRSLNKRLMNRTIAVHVRYCSLYISLPSSAKQQGVLAMKTATAGTKPCKKCIYILPLNVATL